MEPIKFPEANSTLAKEHPQFRPLEVCKLAVDGSPGVFTWTGKYRFSKFELAQINITEEFYFTQTGNCFHPISPRCESPFLSVPVEYREFEDNMFMAYVKNNAGNIDEFGPGSPTEIINAIIGKYNDIDCADQLFFKEKPSMYIGEKGLEEE